MKSHPINKHKRTENTLNNPKSKQPRNKKHKMPNKEDGKTKASPESC